MKSNYLILLFFLLVSKTLIAQHLFEKESIIFSHQDSLRGSINEERAWWDVQYYNLDININPLDSTITGSNTISYQVLEQGDKMQIDLQNPLEITKVIQDDQELAYNRDGNAFFIKLVSPQKNSDSKEITIFYEGKPKPAIKAPWDGGIVWSKDKEGNFFIASACQKIGASVWWPNKDHLYDEVDSMKISVTVPKGMIDVSNGRLKKLINYPDGTNRSEWFVSNPINNYGVSINIGDYIAFSEKYKGEKGILDCEYYVLKNNLEKAKNQFKDVARMLKALEYWFGPYPFYEDSYKLVETPYLGMEHQSAIAYGNRFENGYLGADLSGTGWGKKFDFIIIHESAHEWFGNNITNKDIADMWIHESFANYAESLFLEFHYGKEAAYSYVRGTRKNIINDQPIIGRYDVNNEGSSDMYYKGGNMLHTIRQLIDDDDKWRGILRGLNKTFYHQTVTTKQIEHYITTKGETDCSQIFNQYLRDSRVPTLEYYFRDNFLFYRWNNCIQTFNMPVKVALEKQEKWLKPETVWKKERLSSEKKELLINPDFYVASNKITE